MAKKKEDDLDEVELAEGGEASQKELIPKFRINTGYLLLYMFSIGCNGICVAWTTGGNNQTASIFAAKLGWDAEQTRVNNTLINFASQMGKALGAMVGGQLIQDGRKPIFIKFNILAILSQMLMQILNTYTISLGKFLNGFFVTVVHMANIKMINETVPVYLLGACGTVVGTMQSFGYFAVLAGGIMLPSGDYDPELIGDKENELAKQADVDDQLWRLLYLIPVVLNFVMLINFFCFIREDSIMFNLSQGRDERAMVLIEKLYHPEEDRQRILRILKKQVHKKPASDLTYFEGLCGPKYRRTTIIAMIITFLCQQAGINVFNIISNRLITTINEKLPKDEAIAANTGTQIVGSCLLIGAVASTYIIYRFPRRWLYLRGQFAIAIILALLAYCTYARRGYACMVMIVFFELIQANSIGGLHWIYIPEILTDVQFGFVASFHYFNGVEIAFASEWMIKYLEPDGLFLFYCIITSLGFVFMVFFLKETNGLSDKQKKELYMPKKYRDKTLHYSVEGDGREIQMDTLQEETSPSATAENEEKYGALDDVSLDSENVDVIN